MENTIVVKDSLIHQKIDKTLKQLNIGKNILLVCGDNGKKNSWR